MVSVRPGDVGLDAVVSQETILRRGNRRVVERIAVGVVIQLVAPHIGIHGEQRVSVEGVLITGGDAPAQDALFLILG